MRYYILDTPTKSKQIGMYPQIEYFHADTYDINKESSFQQLSATKFSEIEPDLNCFYLAKKAKITNVLSSSTLRSSIGIFIDNKVVHLFKSNEIKNIKYYSILIDKNYKRKKQVSFNFAHILSSYNILDYQKTKVSNIMTDEESIAGSEENYRTIFNSRDTALLFDTEKYVLNCPVDLVRLPMSIDIYVSEKFKSILEENQITGIEFKPTDKVVLG